MLEGGLIYIFAGFLYATLLKWCSYLFPMRFFWIPYTKHILTLMGAPAFFRIPEQGGSPHFFLLQKHIMCVLNTYEHQLRRVAYKKPAKM